jgi:dTDP-4-dehydrorhamnose reductase
MKEGDRMNIYKNALVIGASGYLGSYVFNSLKQLDNYNVYGTYTNTKKADLIKCNVLNKEDIDKVLNMDFDIVIWCVMNQMEEMKISKLGLKYLISKLSNDVRIIYISTTIGIGKSQDEMVTPHLRKTEDYLEEYVNGKIYGESIIKEHDNHVIIRSGSIYGFDASGEYDSRMKNLKDKYLLDSKFQRTKNLYGSFVNIDDLTKAIIELINVDFKGVINVCESKPINHYEFNKCLAKMMNISDDFIVPDYMKSTVYHTLSSELRESLLETQFRDIRDNLIK